MRAVFALLLLALLAAVAWSFAAAPARGWWLPRGVSTYSGAIDGLFIAISILIGAVLLLTLGLQAWFVVAGARVSATKAVFTHGNAKLELAWTVVTGSILVSLAFAQLSTWNAIHADKIAPGTPPFAEVWAAQFEWRFRYAGDDGRFGTGDDLENPFELVVPVHEPIVLALHSRDVIHSFFVPSFRLKQDVLPGTTLSAWFQAEETGRYDLVCAQLCGFGHYAMAGSIRVVSRPEYEAWIAARKRELMSNGKDENP